RRASWLVGGRPLFEQHKVIKVPRQGLVSHRPAAIRLHWHTRQLELRAGLSTGLEICWGLAMFAIVSRPLSFLVASLALVSLVVVAPSAQAQDKVLKVGTLKLIHGISAYFYEKFAPPGYTVEVVPFESPTDGKNAVVTGTVETCIHGIASFILGAAANEPIYI